MVFYKKDMFKERAKSYGKRFFFFLNIIIVTHVVSP